MVLGFYILYLQNVDANKTIPAMIVEVLWSMLVSNVLKNINIKMGVASYQEAGQFVRFED